MKLIDSILIAITVALLMIFTDQSLRLKHSLGETYFILMLAVGTFLYLRYIRQKRKAEVPPQVIPKTTNKKKKK